ncbi:MAG: tetratricopeptide repeat protein [Balneolaceae bacterium]|nr:tetratricopeptide repeat protein [Balneolaceae bacterium]
MRATLILFFLTVSLSGFAQSSHEIVRNDTTLFNTYTQRAEQFKFTNLDSTLVYANKAKEIVSEELHPEKSALALGLVTWVHFMKGDYDQSLEAADRALQLVSNIESAEKLKIDLLHDQGTIYGAMGMYELGLRKFFEILDYYDPDENPEGYYVTLSNIGVMYMRLELFENALEIFLRLDAEMPTDIAARVSIPVNLGFIYYDLKQFENAKLQLYRALAQEGNIDPRVYGLSNFKLGQVFNAEGNHEEAIEVFNASIDLFESRKNELETVQSLNGLSQAYLGNGNLPKALEFAEQGYKIADRFNAIPEKQATLQSLYLVTKKMGDLEAALKYHEEYKATSDFLKNSETNSQITRIATEYEFKQREAELMAANRQSNLMNNAKIQQQQTLLIASLTAIFLAALAIIGMYRNYHQKKENNYLLSLKNKEIQDQAEKLRQSNRVKDRIFSMIAHDLRGPLSSLYGVISLIEMNKTSQEELDRLIPNVARRFKYTSTLLNNLLQWAQSQMDGYKINPEVFDISYIIKNKYALLQTSIEDKNLQVSTPVGEILVFADLNMIDLVVQNLLSNAIKFSHRDDEICIKATREGDMVSVAFKDNGVGIKDEFIPHLFSDSFFTTKGTMDEKGTGLGLMLCKEFIEKNGGTIHVESSYGVGTTISFTLPLAIE